MRGGEMETHKQRDSQTDRQTDINQRGMMTGWGYEGEGGGQVKVELGWSRGRDMTDEGRRGCNKER